MKVLITGGNGYIAKSLCDKLSPTYDITSVTRDDFDLTNPLEVSNWFKGKKFDVVIHTAITGGNRLQQESQMTLQQNLMMYYNLSQNKKHFNKFISFGSGAEIHRTDTPYGLSKKIIAESMYEKYNFYNIRVYAVFDENELDRRFIKSNIVRYLNKESMIIHKNKLMDFFYMEDLCSLVQFYIECKNPPKQIDATYDDKFTLKNIADMINKLDEHTVDIDMKSDFDSEFYCGLSNLPIDCIGLCEGIRKTYLCLKNRMLQSS